MSKRLMTAEQIRAEKIPFSPSKIRDRVKKREFPAPIIAGGPGPNLWDESDVDLFLAEYIAKAKAAAAQVKQPTENRTDRATAERVRQRAAKDEAKRNAAAAEVSASA